MRLDRAGEPAGSPGEPQAPGPASAGAAEPGPPPVPPAPGAEDAAPRAVETAPASGVAASDPEDDAVPTGDEVPLAGAGAAPEDAEDPRDPAEGPGGNTGEGPGEGIDAGASAAGPAEPRKRRVGRNLPIAVGVGLGLGTLVLVSLYYVKELFLAVMVVFLILGLRELAGAFRTRDIRIPMIPLGLGMVAAPVAAYAWGPEALVAAMALIVLTVLVWRMADGPADGYVRDVTAAVFAAGYLILMGGIVALLMAPEDGDHRIVIFIAVTAASDIGGFFAGTFFGRHRLAPAISPKKTWEGTTGSALTCMLVGAWLMWWLLDDGTLWHGVLIGAVTVVTATVGDLIESMLKRDLGIKDMGTLLPEHGGVMDRLDSLVAAAPMVWLLLEIFVPST